MNLNDFSRAGPEFRGIYKTRNSGVKGWINWTGNWVSFLDSLLQTALLAERADTLRLPTRLRYMRIDPKKHLESVTELDGVKVRLLSPSPHTNGLL